MHRLLADFAERLPQVAQHRFFSNELPVPSCKRQWHGVVCPDTYAR